MKETYGVLGTGFSSKKVIQAALDDIGTKPRFYVPWYGKVTEGLETVYDWLLDNEAEFSLVHPEGSKIPKALTKAAVDVIQAKQVDTYIMETLQYADIKGLATILWDDSNSTMSQTLAEACIDRGLPTLELTNGLVPIIMDSNENAESVEEPKEFDKETLQEMPEAVRKRVTKNKQEEPKRIVSVTIEYSDGTVTKL